jgi:hypothetical protein
MKLLRWSGKMTIEKMKYTKPTLTALNVAETKGNPSKSTVGNEGAGQGSGLTKAPVVVS